MADFADSVLPLGNSGQGGLDGGQLMHDLIVDRNVGEPLDGDARALTDTLAERNAAARHVGTGAKNRCTSFEIVT